MSPLIEAVAIDELDNPITGPDVIQTEDESNISVAKSKRIYKPRVKKSTIVEAPEGVESPVEIPEAVVQTIQVEKDPIIQLDKEIAKEIDPVEPVKLKTKKKDPTVNCPTCNKEMLTKTYKYYHSLKCKPEEEKVEPVKEPAKQEEVKEEERLEKATKEFTKLLKEHPIPIPTSTDRHIKRK